MLRSLSAVAIGRPRLTLAIAAVALPLLGLIGGGARHHLSVGGFIAPAAPSTGVTRHLETVFDTAAPNYLLVATTDAGFMSDADHTIAGTAVATELASEPGVADVLSPWTFGQLPAGVRNPLLAASGKTAVIALRLAGDEDQQRTTADRLARFSGANGPLTLVPTGPAEVSRAAASTAEADLLRGELLIAPLTFVSLLVLFRGWRAAVIPLAVAVLAIVSTLGALRVLASYFTISVFALNLTTFLGLGLSVDYALLLVSRFREERATGFDPVAATRRTMATGGRTVVVSATTVVLSMLALFVFPVPYLRSFAVAGVLIVTAAAAAACTVAPALLVLFGRRLHARHVAFEVEETFWGRQANRVMARPLWWAAAVATLLVATGLPFLRVDAGRIDERVLPPNADARAGATLVRQDLGYPEFNPITVVASWIDPDDQAAVDAFGQRLLALDGVRRVDSAAGFATADLTIPPTLYNERFRAGANDGTWFSVVITADPDSHQAEAVVYAIRALDGRITVGGTTATIIDSVAVVTDRLPWAVAIIAVTTLVLLFLLTGGVLLAVKGLILNLLSLTSTFGLLVWMFQDGHASFLTGVTATGRIDVFTPVLVFCIAFGLSMDYQVFLLARITEQHDQTNDTEQSVVQGLAHTGRTVTAAAALMALAVSALASSEVTTAKMLGVGLTVAVLVDAFAVRATLVPALMALAGPANWWAPAPLRRFQARYRISETPRSMETGPWGAVHGSAGGEAGHRSPVLAATGRNEAR